MWDSVRLWAQLMPPWGQVTKLDSMRGQELFQILSNYMATVTELGTVCGCEGQVDASEAAAVPTGSGRRRAGCRGHRLGTARAPGLTD